MLSVVLNIILEIAVVITVIDNGNNNIHFSGNNNIYFFVTK